MHPYKGKLTKIALYFIKCRAIFLYYILNFQQFCLFDIQNIIYNFKPTKLNLIMKASHFFDRDYIELMDALRKSYNEDIVPIDVKESIPVFLKILE